MPYTDFHYTPTGTGVISGKEVLEQTEDAINDLGGQISGDVQTAIDTANNALNVANTASTDAQNAVNTANTAHTAATNAQNTANAAQTTATNAQTAAQNAQNDVNALGNRVTTAENNITQNTTDISGLTTRMGTAEGNITTLQNDVVTAQGTATSAQNTATMARQQAYVLRYSSTAITDNSTIAYSTLDNTDNIKVSDKIIDTDGKIFSIVSVDSDNSTVTVGTALIDLALDANVVHTNEINSSGIGIIGSVKEVGGVDFNTLTTQGLYGANASGSTNGPENSPCVVQVIKRQNSVIQIANVSSFAYKSRYIRYCADITAQPPVWQSWVKFATDDNVMHLSGNETKSGELTASKFISNYFQSETGYIQIQSKGSNRSVSMFNGGSAGDGGGFWAYGKDSTNGSDCRLQIYNTAESRYERVDLVSSQFLPTPSGELDCGGTSNKWKTFNGLNPGSLSLPDLNNGIDISGYITIGSDRYDSNYTAPDDGWISFYGYAAALQAGVIITNGEYAQTSWSIRRPDLNFYVGAMLPVRNGDTVTISTNNISSIIRAYFIPCQGNV